MDTGKPAKSLHRMLSKNGNLSMDNLAAILDALRRKLGGRARRPHCRSGVMGAIKRRAWLGDLDSNQDRSVQSREFYR